MRRRAAVAALGWLAPMVAAGVLVRPAAAGTAYDELGVTGLVSGARTAGVVGNSGGLVTLDSGSASVSARLDSSPSAQVRAAPYEPGTLTRTLVGQGNGAAGQAVLAVPDAEARYPGAQSTATCCQAPPVAQGPLTFGAAQATAATGATFANGTATGASYAIAGVLSMGPSTSSLTMTADAATARVAQHARTAVSRVEVAGVLVLSDVVASAAITADGDLHTAAQALTVGGASVSGQAVEIGNDGITAVGTAVIPGQTLEAATAQANAQLAAAGVTVHTVGGRATHDARSAGADTGGVEIVVASPPLPGGVATNTLTVVVGGVSLTEADTVAAPVALPPAVLPPVTGVPGTSTTTTYLPGTPAAPVVRAPDQAAPQVAAPPTVVSGFILSGRRISDRTALIAFAGWQLLSLGSATLYAFVERRRRLVLMGRPA